uniref:Uncharacterized protein n=1 Tax=Setaria italica TaxID=4555 RepID=K3YBG0_SETIT
MAGWQWRARALSYGGGDGAVVGLWIEVTHGSGGGSRGAGRGGRACQCQIRGGMRHQCATSLASYSASSL